MSETTAEDVKKLTRNELDKQLTQNLEKGEYQTEDLAATFFNRYGYKLRAPNEHPPKSFKFFS